MFFLSRSGYLLPSYPAVIVLLKHHQNDVFTLAQIHTFVTEPFQSNYFNRWTFLLWSTECTHMCMWNMWPVRHGSLSEGRACGFPDGWLEFHGLVL